MNFFRYIVIIIVGNKFQSISRNKNDRKLDLPQNCVAAVVVASLQTNPSDFVLGLPLGSRKLREKTVSKFRNLSKDPQLCNINRSY